MAFDDEKTLDGGAPAGLDAKSQSVIDPKHVSDTDSTNMEKPIEVVQDNSDSEYPHGAKLIILSSAALAAVFLVALDQVRCPSPSVAACQT
jgi:hypothetical protein